MDREVVEKMAKLARIDISEDEAKNLAGELGNILGYVSDLKVAINNKQETITKKEDFPNRNVMREDDGAHESGLHTEALLSSAPERDGDYIRVKKIL